MAAFSFPFSFALSFAWHATFARRGGVASLGVVELKARDETKHGRRKGSHGFFMKELFKAKGFCVASYSKYKACRMCGPLV